MDRQGGGIKQNWVEEYTPLRQSELSLTLLLPEIPYAIGGHSCISPFSYDFAAADLVRRRNFYYVRLDDVRSDGADLASHKEEDQDSIKETGKVSFFDMAPCTPRVYLGGHLVWDPRFCIRLP